MSDLVSVIVPVYNVEKYLEKCVESLLQQHYKNLEILLVEDCSTDCSLKIALRYAQRFPEKCKVIRHECNSGLSAARNTGMDHATGDWIAFVDSDDWVTEDYISRMYEIACKDDADIVMCALYYYYPDGKTVKFSPFSNLRTEDSHKRKVALCKPYANTRLFRRTFLEKNQLRFPVNIRRSEDIAVIVPLFTKTQKISIVDKPMYYYLQRTISLSNQNDKNIDLSFYPKCLKLMNESSAKGFELELEFRTVSELVYGMTMLQLRAGRKRKELVQHLDSVDNMYPNWPSNPYLRELPRAKRVFMQTAKKRQFVLLKLFIAVWDLKRIIKG